MKRLGARPSATPPNFRVPLLDGPIRRIASAADAGLSDDPATLAVLGRDGSLIGIDIAAAASGADSAELWRIAALDIGYALALGEIRGVPICFAAGRGDRIVAHTLADGSPRRTLRLPGEAAPIRGVTLAEPGGPLVIATQAGQLSVYDVPSYDRIATVDTGLRGITAVAARPESGGGGLVIAVSASDDATSGLSKSRTATAMSTPATNTGAVAWFQLSDGGLTRFRTATLPASVPLDMRFDLRRDPATGEVDRSATRLWIACSDGKLYRFGGMDAAPVSVFESPSDLHAVTVRRSAEDAGEATVIIGGSGAQILRLASSELGSSGASGAPRRGRFAPLGTDGPPIASLATVAGRWLVAADDTGSLLGWEISETR